MIRSLKRRLEKLEQRLISRLAAGTPEPIGDAALLRWPRSHPGERQSYWSMYQQRAKEFWKDQE